MPDLSALGSLDGAVGAGAVAFGVAGALVPALVGSAYGMGQADSGQVFMTRLWGSRNLALGGIVLSAGSPAERKRFAAVGAGMNAIDVAAAALTPGLPLQTRVMAGATSALFAGLLGYLATRSS